MIVRGRRFSGFGFVVGLVVMLVLDWQAHHGKGLPAWRHLLDLGVDAVVGIFWARLATYRPRDPSPPPARVTREYRS